MLMALLLLVGDFRLPSFLFQKCFNTENGILVMVMSIDIVSVHDKAGISDIPPLISISDTWDVPCCMAYGSGDKLTKLKGLWHRMTSFQRKKATCHDDRSPGCGIAGDKGRAIKNKKSTSFLMDRIKGGRGYKFGRIFLRMAMMVLVCGLPYQWSCNEGKECFFILAETIQSVFSCNILKTP